LKWGNAAGHIESGETAIQGAIRETNEETGLNFSEHDLRPIGMEKFDGLKQKLELNLFVAFLRNKKKPNVKLSFEHTAYGFFKWDDIINNIDLAETAGLNPITLKIIKKYRGKISQAMKNRI
jgi:8-oxo-dGTP pyrophosphatase MutT (NUDIX family)